MQTTESPPRAPAYPYDGPEDLRDTVLAALTRVVDPELALSIVDVGLIYSVTVTADTLQVHLTMTSPACPVADVILGDVEDELDRVLPDRYAIEVQLGWEPPWDATRMSPRARRFMGW
jgi:metal-sulfur cluster biosynthetic enzyme